VTADESVLIGLNLTAPTLPAFAREAGYRKLVVQVRGTSAHAQSFYRRLGFAECGRLSRQVMIDGSYDDEILMELFL
jgi:ribosomal protein S18 acetylase RimI-like enzyme